MFWVISVYFNIRNTLPKFCPFILGHPAYTRTHTLTSHTVHFSVQKIERTNSATLSGPLQQFVTMNCTEFLSPSHCHSLLLSTFRGPGHFSPAAAECVHSVESVNGVGRGEEEANLISCTQGSVNILLQTSCLEIFLQLYFLSCLQFKNVS